MSKITHVNAWNGWDPLKQVVLGNIYKPDFFDAVKDSKTRDMLQTLLYETHEDLANFKRQMEMAGVDVIQFDPNLTVDGEIVTSIEEFPDIQDRFGTKSGLVKPYLSPRDDFITLGNRVLFCGDSLTRSSRIKSYFENPERDFHTPFMDNNLKIEVAAPNITRLGKRLIIDTKDHPAEHFDILLKEYDMFEQVTHTVGGHNDGVFCPIKPGYIIATEYKNRFEHTIPDWEVYTAGPSLSVLEDSRRLGKFNKLIKQKNTIDKTWWHPMAKDNHEFNAYVDEYLHEWVGWAAESIFIVNMLVISPELVFCPSYDKKAFDYIKSIGMEPVLVPFRHRHFWDAGLHCLTVDIVRDGTQQDYWKF